MKVNNRRGIKEKGKEWNDTDSYEIIGEGERVIKCKDVESKKEKKKSEKKYIYE